MAKKRKKRRRRPGAPPAPSPQSANPGAPGVDPAPARASAERPAPARRRRKPGADEPPPAPWGSFPLVELVVLVGIVLLVTGFIVSGNQGTVMIVTGLVLASLGGLELAIREHFAGYRSHTLVLAGTAAVACLAILFIAAPAVLSPPLRLAAGAAVFGLAAWGLTVAFRRASGGLAFRIRGFRG
jgi:hypothetical protein